MAAESIAFTGPITFAKNQSWHGATELHELCLCTSQTTKPSDVYKVTFQVNAVVPLAAIKLYMLKSERWRAYNMEGHSELSSFLSGVFGETVGLFGPTIKALIVQINQIDNNQATSTNKYPLRLNSKLLFYAERQRPQDVLTVYAQPIYASDEFTSVYHLENLADFSETMSQHGESISVTQILGPDLPILTTPKQEVNEMDLIRKIEASTKKKEETIHTENNRNIFKVDKNARNIRKRLHSKPLKTVFNTHTKKPIPKKTVNLLSPKPSSSSPTPSRPSPIPTKKALSVEEKKMMIKKLIKETLIQLNYDKKSEETSQLFQQIYLSMRYAFRNVLSTSTELDEGKLKYIIKLHADFYSNLDAVIDIFHPNESSL